MAIRKIVGAGAVIGAASPKATAMNLTWPLIASAVLVLAIVHVRGWAWATLLSDARLPIRWGIDGRPDRYGGKAEALLLVPALAVVLTGVVAALPTVEPRRGNLLQSQGAYQAAWVAVMVLLVATHAVVILRPWVTRWAQLGSCGGRGGGASPATGLQLQ